MQFWSAVSGRKVTGYCLETTIFRSLETETQAAVHGAAFLQCGTKPSGTGQPSHELRAFPGYSV